MENTSKKLKAIPRRERAYYRRRNQNKLHLALASFFAEEAAAGRITKKQLAALLEKNPAQITRWLTEASNYEADTISDILLAMGAEMDHRVVRFSECGKANFIHPIIRRLTQSATTGLSNKYRPLERAKTNARILELEPA